MDATSLRNAVIARMTQKDYLGALPMIEQAAAGAQGVSLGVVRWLEAWVRVAMDVHLAHVAAALMKESLPLLDGAPELQAQALLVGFYVASLSHDPDLSSDVPRRARALLTDTSPQVKPWHGRLLYRLGLYWKGDGKNLTKAEATLRNSIEWHHRNVGPYNEHDRRCHMRHTLVALGEVHLARGQRSEAGARLREAQRLLDDNAQRYTLLHLQGLIAEADHRDAEAIDAYQHAWASARDVSDWVALAESAAAYGRILRRLREWDKLREVLRPLVEELIEAGLPSEAHRLQLLAVPSGGEEDETI